MTSKRCVIVGASHAGTQVAARLRAHNWGGDIDLIGDELSVPYHRPPLSKDYLIGVKTLESLYLRAGNYYAKANINLRLGVRANAISRSDKTVTLSTGERVPYDKLVLAMGASPRKLPVPGAELDGVYYLRTAEDVDRIRADVAPGKRALVIGAGYIGLEVAASLRILGLQVTVLEAMPRILQRVTCERVSEFLSQVHQDEGVTIRVSSSLRAIVGPGRVTGVEIDSGEKLPADLVVVGIGVVPETALAEAAGLNISDGIAVDQYARTSDPDIYANGDCASFVHPKYGRRIRLESVQNANDQGDIAARHMCAKATPYTALPWFWSDQFDLKMQIAGLAFDVDEVLERQDPGDGRNLSVCYLRAGRLTSVCAINRPRDFIAARRLITDGARIDRSLLADPLQPLTEARQ
jgi:3-phenylpropionate/trans-cinnamate dioxygenase ferredoxin reductase subunit